MGQTRRANELSTTERQLLALAAVAGYRSVYALSRAAGVDRHTILAVMRGRRKPLARTVQRLARVLGTPAEVVGMLLESAHVD